MVNNQISIVQQKQTSTLEVGRMATYLQSKIIEALDENGKTYYLFFYKNEYLTYCKATHVHDESFLKSAFTSGITFSSHHPLTQVSLNLEKPYRKYSFQQLCKRNEQKYTHQECAVIATYFDSFIPKDELLTYIKEIFYQYQRNGQTYLGYRIIKILQSFAPEDQWVQDFGSKLAYNKYEDIYNKPSEELQKKDPVWAEQMLFLQMDQDLYYDRLCSILKKEHRMTELITIALRKFSMSPSQSVYSSLLSLCEEHFNLDQTVVILETLLTQHPSFEPLYKDIMKIYKTLNQPTKLLQLVIENNLPIPHNQLTYFESIFDQIDLESENIKVESLNKFIPKVYSSDVERQEKFIRKCVHHLLKKHDITFIEEWVGPMKANGHNLPIFHKIEQMLQIRNDPDQQQQLGELYFQFQHFDQAIECFSFEMELKENDPKPVKWLSKVYQEIGLTEESKAYQQLYKDMQKNA
ncbi:tetratricopeptide repeat protein [Salinibacillus xinjiangensis]|uniref:Uncharacterized protein n=1 Tax=Salinibacillus xinjiangensis TaxID=1229268 RepID=A0A6G1X615_9BACI|nr:hypothetical protein [Salinibacillus xinjiangensis]MRG86346.1 hypothetical protein [Salinibacillus xinjiangensis]